MRRKLLIILLALGTLGGYAAGCAGCCGMHHGRREAFERHVAKICVEAARSVPQPQPAPAPKPPPPASR